MNILTTLLTKIGLFARSKHEHSTTLRQLKYTFEDECALCNNKIDYSRFIEVENKKVPTCLYCKALVENGTKWTSILKKNYGNEKRRYCNKYLRIVAWFSDFD